MRKLHRWIAIVAAAFLINKAATGTLLAFDEIFVQRPPIAAGAAGMAAGARPAMISGPAGADGATTPIEDAEALRMLSVVHRAAEQAFPNTPVLSIRLRTLQDSPQGIVSFGGENAQTVVFDAHTGERIENPFTLLTRHQILKSLHRGDIFGFNGRFLDVAVGLSLLFLCVSAITMYAQLLSRRIRAGHKNIFWR